jgi:hypothetical protein
VTCEEIRELFSARVDATLSADERTRLDAHLATCADCAREWEHFAGTVEMLRAVAPARAPAGFVDRVMAARPRPWYRRLARSLFMPWPVKLPLEAAALVLIAGLAILLFQRSPDLQQATRAPAPPASVMAPPPPAPSSPGEPASVQAPPGGGRPGAAHEASAKREAESPPSSSDTRRDAAPAAGSSRPAVEPPGEERAETPEPHVRREADEPRENLVGRQAGRPSPAPAMRKSSEVQARVTGPTVQARLAVGDSARAERAVRDLVIRQGGEVVARIDEPGALVLRLVVPGERWDEVRRGLEALGALRLEGEREGLADPVQVTLRLES